jgi:pimeloyl-ACP methyl ester carboxylesterase
MPWRTINQIRDMMGLLWAPGYRSTEAVVGHDFGAIVASWCALVRPDVFRRLALMSGPFRLDSLPGRLRTLPRPRTQSP